MWRSFRQNIKTYFSILKMTGLHDFKVIYFLLNAQIKIHEKSVFKSVYERTLPKTGKLMVASLIPSHVSFSVLRYKESFTKLRSLKTEIEHLQHLLEKAKVKMQKDFEIWWAEQASQTLPQVGLPRYYSPRLKPLQ